MTWNISLETAQYEVASLCDQCPRTVVEQCSAEQLAYITNMTWLLGAIVVVIAILVVIDLYLVKKRKQGGDSQ